jgi:hypothetical protein
LNNSLEGYFGSEADITKCLKVVFRNGSTHQLLVMFRYNKNTTVFHITEPITLISSSVKKPGACPGQHIEQSSKGIKGTNDTNTQVTLYKVFNFLRQIIENCKTVIVIVTALKCLFCFAQ